MVKPPSTTAAAALFAGAGGRAARSRARLVTEYALRTVEVGDWQSATVALKDASLHGVPLPSKALAAVIRCAGRDGRFVLASRLFRGRGIVTAGPPTLEMHEAMVGAARHVGQWQYALHLVKRAAELGASGTSPTGPAGGGGKHRVGLSTAMMNEGIAACVRAPHAWETAILTFQFCRKPQQAHAIPDYLGNQQGGAATARVESSRKQQELIEPPSGGADVDGSERLDQDVSRPTAVAPANTSGLSPSASTASTVPLATQGAEIDSSTLLTMATLLARHDRWLEVLRLTHAAERQRLPIAAGVRDALVRSLHRARQHVLAVNEFDRAVARHASLTEDTCRMVLRSADETAHEQRSGSTAWATACTIVAAFASQQVPLTQLTYEGALRASCASGQWRAALNVLTNMRHDGFVASSANVQSVWCARASRADTYEAAYEMLRHNPAVEFYSTSVWNALGEVAVRCQAWRQFYALRKMMSSSSVASDTRVHELRVLAAYRQSKWVELLREFVVYRERAEQDVRATSTFARGTKDEQQYLLRRVAADVVPLVEAALAAQPAGDALARAVRELLAGHGRSSEQ